MKKTVTLLLTLALLFSCIVPLQALASVEGWYEVRSTSPNGYCYLYSKATSESGVSQNLGRYDNGDLVYVLEEEGRYVYVKTQDEKYGYIKLESLRRYYGEVESASDKRGWYVVRSKDPNGYCYLYSNPTSRDGYTTNLGRYDNGEKVYVLDYYGGGEGNVHYCRVQTTDGKTGYIRSSSLVRSGSGPAPTIRPTAKPTVRPTATPRPTARPTGKLAQLPELTLQCYGNVRGGNTIVYTGPDDSYYRTTSGKAYVANGGSLRVYGKENGHYLVQYAANLNGKSVPRWSFIPASRFTAKDWVDSLDHDWLPITIRQNAHVSDAPTWTHAYSSRDVEIVQDSAFALSKYIDGDGTYWVYFEALGYADTVANQGYVSIRGFVPLNQVSLRE